MPKHVALWVGLTETNLAGEPHTRPQAPLNHWLAEGWRVVSVTAAVQAGFLVVVEAPDAATSAPRWAPPAEDGGVG